MAKRKPKTKPQEAQEAPAVEETDEDGFPVHTPPPVSRTPEPDPKPEPRQETPTVAKTKSSTPPGEEISKADAVRAAIAAGVEEPKKGVEWIREKYGMEVSAATFSVTKSQDKKKSGGSGEKTPRAARAPRQASSPAAARPSGNGSPSDMLRQVKTLVDTYGADEVRNVLALLEG